MRSIANYFMQGRMQATLGVAIMAIPGLFWIGTAVASLVLLRRGISQALQISILGLFIALISWHFGKPTSLLVLVGSLVLAHILRQTVSWVYTLLVSVIIGISCYWWFYLYPSAEMLTMTQMVAQQLPNMFQETYKITPAESIELTNLLIPIIIPAIYATGIQVFCIISIIVARYWQALLYNPNGFKKEFYQLKLPIWAVTLLIVGILIIPSLDISQVMLMFACSIPLVITGLAITHALLAKTQIKFVVIIVYIMFVFAIYIIYPLLVILAIIDSFLNLRKLSSANTVA